MSAVLEYLQGRGVAFTILPSPISDHPVRTAKMHGLSAQDVVAVHVMTNGLGDALMVVPADQGIDIELACEALGEPDSRFASVRELESRYYDYEPGCVPPLRFFFMLPIYVDPQVMRHHWTIFALGRPGLAVRMRTRDLFRDDEVVMTPLTLRSLEPVLVPTKTAAVDEEPGDDLTIVLGQAE